VIAKVYLKPGRDKPIRGRNPWIFSQAIQRTEPADLEPGALVEIFDSAGEKLGFGYYHPATTIAVRVLDWGEQPAAMEAFIARRFENAAELRRRLITRDTNCYRLINGDGDGLSGLVVDRYAEVVVLQILTAGMDRLKDLIVAEIQRWLKPSAIVERSQGAVRREEGLEDVSAVLAGEPPREVEVLENGIKFLVDVAHGQKTGHFLDQRENRSRFGALAGNASVLDAYCYSAGFSLAALRGGAARITALDTSSRALETARRNLELNNLQADAVNFLRADAMEFLARTDERFDLIVLDPPPLARSRADVKRAEHLYVNLNAMAMRALAPGGRMMTFSCSVHFRGEDFVQAVRIGVGKAGRSLRMLERLGAGPDHPVQLGHVEGEYLTGVLLADL
jgi:23S rRNA (cytosine1962-C5)-methyltransferase